MPGCGFSISETRFLPHLPVSVLCLVGEVLFIQFLGPPSKGGLPHVLVDLLCPWGEMSSASSYVAILDPLLY